MYPQVALGLTDIALPPLHEAGNAFAFIGRHAFAVATVRRTDGLAAQLWDASIARVAFASIRRHTLLMRATALGAVGATK